MEVRFWAATDVGKKRGHNEDNFLVDRDLRLFIVCDGMGGHSAGEVASAVAVQTILEEIREGASDLGMFDEEGPPPSDDAICELLELAVRHASDRIMQLGEEDESRKGMGTTCSLLMFLGDRGFVAHVGDSRIYRVSDGQVERVTEDHSLRNEMLRQGKIDPDESLDQENAVVRAVGVSEDVEVDTWIVTPDPGDRFVLCSDGLTDYIDVDDEVADLVDDPDLEEATETCIDFANRSGGEDNVTVIVTEVAEGDGVLDARELRPRLRALREVPLFEYLDPEELEHVVEHTRMKTADHGGLLFGPGRPIDGLYIILDGEVEVGEAGQVAATLESGAFFGVRALVGHEPLGFTAELASDTVRMLTMDREAFHELLGEDAELATKILWNCIDWFGERAAYLSVDELRNPEQLVDASVRTHEIDVSSIERPTTDSTTGSRDEVAFGGEDDTASSSEETRDEDETARQGGVAVAGDTPPPSDISTDGDTPPPSDIASKSETRPPVDESERSGSSRALGSSSDDSAGRADGTSATSGARSSLGDRPESGERASMGASRESGDYASPSSRAGNEDEDGERTTGSSTGGSSEARGSGVEPSPSISVGGEGDADGDSEGEGSVSGGASGSSEDDTDEDRDALEELKELAEENRMGDEVGNEETVNMNLDDEEEKSE